MSLYRRYPKENPPRHIVQSRARAAVRKAILAGELTRQPCEVCGVERVHGHHDDYAKPLKVRWLCALHHRRLHTRAGLTPDEVAA